jgi:hypothetical protein
MATILERLTVFTLLGIRFWDPVENQQVSHDLDVSAWPATNQHLVTNAFRTNSGIYAFQGLPGMRSYENVPTTLSLDDDPDDIGSPIETSPLALKEFVVQVQDRSRRFLPLRFHVDLPLDYPGVYKPAGHSSPLGYASARVYLFSAPSRPVKPGLAVVRGCLYDRRADRPAAFALVDILHNGRMWHGLADERGCVAIFFPYPPFIEQLGASPPALSLAEQVWPLALRVRYDPALTLNLTEGELPPLADLCSQPLVDIWSDEIGLPQSEQPLQLTFGEELILRTGSRSMLHISV